jgi:2-polyprenyl-6-methoxyphenol hydroxylase-like FAD-dependent oxidoreductase
MALCVGLAMHAPHLSVTLVEKRQSFTRAGATLGFAANGVKALKELCSDGGELVDSICQRGVDMQPIHDIPVWIIPWWILRDALLQKAQEQKIQIRTGMELEEIIFGSEEDDSTTLVFSKNERIHAKLVVGADGVHSTVRSLIGLPPAMDTGMNVVRGHLVVNEEEGRDITSSENLPQLSSLLETGMSPIIVRDPDLSCFNVFNHHQKTPGLLMWQIGTPRQCDSNTELEMFCCSMASDPIEKHFIRQIWEQTDPNHITKTKLSVQDMSQLPASGWGGRGRVTLIGDAAHACRPTDGQGGNLALEDCIVLCRLLAKDSSKLRLQSSQRQCHDLVTEFEESRLARVKTIHDDQRVRAELQGDQWRPLSPEYLKWLYAGV